MAQNTEDLDESSIKQDISDKNDDSKEKYDRIVKDYDLETNHPQKLFRALKDLKSEMDDRKYSMYKPNDPKLVPSMEGVASFDGNLKFEKTVKARSIGKITAGAIVAVFGFTLLFDSFNSPDLFYYLLPPQLYYYPLLSNLFSNSFSASQFLTAIVLIVIGIAILSRKTKTKLTIEITLEGESYQYKGQKETKSLDVEIRARADVLSDLRLTLIGKKSNNSKKAEEILLNDMSFLDNKLSTIVPNFRVPTVKQ